MEKTKEIDILDVFIVLAKHKKFIFWTTLIVSIAAVVYSLLVPQYWVSTASILPAEDRVSRSFSGSLMDLGSSFLGGSGKNNAISLVSIMKSRTFSERVINKFDLMNYFEIDEPDSLISLELALIKLKEKIVSIQINDESGLIYINAETKNKKLSADIANYYVERIEEYNQKTRMTKGRQKRIFLEKRLAEIESNLQSLSNQLKIFYKQNNAIDLTEQTKVMLDIYSELISKKMQKEVQLELAAHSMVENAPIIETLKKEIDVLSNKIKELEKSEINSDFKYGLSLDDVSDLIVEYADLELKIRIEKALYEFMYPQYEQARLEELRDLPSIEVIDVARLSGLRSKPQRAMICIFSFLASFILTSIVAMLYEFFLAEEQKFKKLMRLLKK
jgi:uncharacterized protein involved in exopolysaccharide biosynthesis